jgi:prevent-host-death family protein
MTIQTSEARIQIDEAIERVIKDGERVTLERDGRGVVALVPFADLQRLEELEDEEDHRAAEEARAEGGQPTPIEEVAREWGIPLKHRPGREN